LSRPLKNICKIITPELLADQLLRFASGIIAPTSKPKRDICGKDIVALQTKFDEIVKQHPAFVQDVYNAIDHQSKIIFVRGLKFPEIHSSQIPKSNYISDSILQGNRDVALCKIMSGLCMGLFVVPTKNDEKIFNPIFPTSDGRGRNNQFDGDKDLLWHNDSWHSAVDELTILVGVKGHDAVKTKVILAEQIINYFKEKGKEEELKLLMSQTTIAQHQLDFDFNYGTIIDPKTHQVRFAEYGCFGHHQANEKMKGAIQLLRQYINEIDPIFSESLQSGDILILQNKHGIHAKESPIAIGLGERFLLRHRREDSEVGLREKLPRNLVEIISRNKLTGNCPTQN